MRLPLLFAHRGGKFWESDDFSYITQSIADGADIIELDIRMRDEEYMVQHMPYDKVQGPLQGALARLEHAALCLDVKVPLDVNRLVEYVRGFTDNPLIISSYNTKLLAQIRDPDVVRDVNCILPGYATERGHAANADWITIPSMLATYATKEKIDNAGFVFIASGNQIFKRHERMENQLRFARWGAPLISTHHIAEMKKFLEENL